MKPREVFHGNGRRNFFKNAALLGGAAVLAVMGKRAGTKPSPDLSDKSRSRGYRLTAHIRKYYEKASL